MKEYEVKKAARVKEVEAIVQIARAEMAEAKKSVLRKPPQNKDAFEHFVFKSSRKSLTAMSDEELDQLEDLIRDARRDGR